MNSEQFHIARSCVLDGLNGPFSIGCSALTPLSLSNQVAGAGLQPGAAAGLGAAGGGASEAGPLRLPRAEGRPPRAAAREEEEGAAGPHPDAHGRGLHPPRPAAHDAGADHRQEQVRQDAQLCTLLLSL